MTRGAPISASVSASASKATLAKSGIYKDISTGIASAGIEYYLPLFFDETASIFDYLPKDAIFVTHGDAPAAIAAFWNDTRSRYNLLQGDKGTATAGAG
jgi:transcription-repair coupling factor (superfamily II helicase)